MENKDRWMDSESRWYLLNKTRVEKQYEIEKRLNEIAHAGLYERWKKEDEQKDKNSDICQKHPV